MSNHPSASPATPQNPPVNPNGKNPVPGQSSVHRELLERLTPDWLIQATPERRAAIKNASTNLPDWFQRATIEQQRALQDCFSASFKAQTQLDKTMSGLQTIDAFAAPILVQALKHQFGVEADIHKTFVCLRRALAMGDLEIEVSSFEVMKLTLLQAALHNFEESECEEWAFHRSSGFVKESTTAGTFEVITVDMTATQFLTLCRSLDIGAQYQVYLNDFFHPAEIQRETELREQYIASQKTAMRAAAELALLKKDIEPEDYQMILSVIDGVVHPWQGDKQVWFRDLSVMKRRMVGCVVFSISEQYRYTNEFIVYVPHDPQHPFKRYTTAQMREEFKRQFTARDDSASDDAAPTAHQRFFSQFVAYADQPYYYSQFSRQSDDAPADPMRSVWIKAVQLIPPFSTVTRIKELPPEPQGKRVPVEDPYLNPFGIIQEGAGLWSANTDLWVYLYEQNRAKAIADARGHAVPTADVDARVRAEKLNHLLELGMLGLNLVSMFVPVLGEIMMTVMAGQLLYESFEGAIEWSEGDRNAAKAHLVDVAENLALIGVMAGVGKGLGKFTAVKPEPVVERLEPIKRSDGQSRLWKPDLSAYQRDITLDDSSGPDARGLHRMNGNTYLRQSGKVYEVSYDETLKKWRINHPTDAQAWRPILEHNGQGAWRHASERPLTWDRLTLLRRMGPATNGITDEQLLKIADACGVSDNALRKMHMDHLPIPSELADALQVFAADHGIKPDTRPAPAQPLIARLQRECPGLGEAVAQRVLLDANAEELTRLKGGQRVPLRMLEEARWYAQQGRVSQAFADLYVGRVVSADSNWLALHALEKLPGWSGDVRLEIRDGHIDGPLIDGIGRENAASRKYVVKQGPAYQAFNERGEELNSVPRNGDNFFASIMHALPDEARQALGVPQVSQHVFLKRAVVDVAKLNRVELGQRLEARWGRKKAFKPPVRVAERKVGYYASGRGQGLNPSLVTRVRDVYPGLTDQQANGLILKQLRAGMSDAQIFGWLQARIREWQALELTLDQWVGESTNSVPLFMLEGKVSVARDLKQSWRNAPLIEENPRFGSLELICNDPLPSLSADFSHVRDLAVRGRCITDANADTFLQGFPQLESLLINATSDEFSTVPDVLKRMSGLKRLSLRSSVPYAADFASRLGALTTLEELIVFSQGLGQTVLDVSQLRNLRKLRLDGFAISQWPDGALDLPHLEHLDLRGTWIFKLPDAMFTGHEKLWSGLSMEWSLFPREHFKPVFEYLNSHPEIPFDREAMVSDYCTGELARFGETRGSPTQTVIRNFFEQWQGAQARFEAVEALSDQHGLLDRQLNEWTDKALQPQLNVEESLRRAMASSAIRICWRNGAFSRYGYTANASVLELPNLRLETFPELPTGAFPHLKTLYLTGNRAAAQELRSFVHSFTELETLDLSGNGLSEVPIAPGELAKLTRLDLSGNQIVDGSIVRQALDGLPALQSLDLSNNPLTSLEVSGMVPLKALDLRSTNLSEWPAGAQDLLQLSWLDLRDSKISSLPETALQGDMLLKTDLSGAPLTPQAMTALNAARQRIELAKGLPSGSLERFAWEQVPSTFPPTETGFSLTRYLLPLPDVPAGEGAAHFTKRLQRLNPTLADDEALQVIEQMREAGATDAHITERLSGWDQTFEALIRQLNGWLYTRESRSTGWTISAEGRRLGALRILDCWREGLTAKGSAADSVLNLNGLQLGDLPELPAEFSHVGSLNLTGVRLTAQGSDGFLQAFRHLKALELSGNDLEALPWQIQNMDKLERLELSANEFSDVEQLYSSLSHLQHLRWLDLGYNGLDTFDVGVFERLETLNLSHNNLTEWPQGVLDATHLNTLNLSSNDITSIPSAALNGNHDVLMTGVDLSDNYNLSRESVERLRSYLDAGPRDTALGFSRSDLDDLVDESIHTEENTSNESDEDLADEAPDDDQLQPWLANASAEALPGKTKIWNELAAEPDNAAFFHLLSRLQDTQEFRVANADLTRRVWTVLEAAASNSELRKVLFASSNTHGTCVDGRILTFSGLESKVFKHNALLEIPAGRLTVKGAALLKLSRQLFRLDKVDEMATKAANRNGQDQAEVRLGYRIGLTGGWSDGVELPGQPKHMTYASGVTRAQLDEVREAVVNAEHSDAFFEDLIQRDYWMDYLKEKYPEEILKLNEADVAQEFNENDEAAMMSSLFDHAVARNSKMIELSRKEVEEIERAGSLNNPNT